MEPEETTVDERPRRRRCLWGYLGMLGAVIVVETFVARHRLDLTDTASLTWVMSGKAAAIEARDSEIFCVGDSLA